MKKKEGKEKREMKTVETGRAIESVREALERVIGDFEDHPDYTDGQLAGEISVGDARACIKAMKQLESVAYPGTKSSTRSR